MKKNYNLTQQETLDISKANKIFEGLTLFGEYIQDLKNKTYQKFPYAGMVFTVLAIVWWISPLDLDFIPYIGWIDDAFGMPMVFVSAWCYELSKYRKWREDLSA